MDTRVARPVLLIDDSPDIREAFMVLMEFEGFAVVTLESAQKGLEYLAANPIKPLIIILDLTMPDMDGHGFLKERAARNLAPDVPIIVFSAHRQTETLPGTVGWAKKPIDVDELIALIRKHT